LERFLTGGYDYINMQELTIAKAMKTLGYKTAHFGKWHNGRTLGYEPWNQGFEESWMPQPHLHLDNVFIHNGDYKPTKGLMEERLMDRMLDYLDDQKKSSSPFFMYYATHVPHT
jgi:arylsulfatase A-like enzyme